MTEPAINVSEPVTTSEPISTEAIVPAQPVKKPRKPNPKHPRSDAVLLKRYPDRIRNAEYIDRVNSARRLIGQPTEYRPEYNEIVLKLARQGYTLAMIAAELNYTRGVLYMWSKKHPEFGETMELVKDIRQAWMERKALDHLIETKDGDRINTSLWNFMMARTCKDYSDQAQTVITKVEPTEIPLEVKEKLEALETRIRSIGK
jgi:hypothetical protein